tara:strand:- start:1165 stop:1767 length:603 start_codon:yes stop_codon:yes gene_type:complete
MMIDSLYLGPEYDLSNIEGDKVCSMDVAKLIDQQKIVAIFQGRSEAGPRALGNRSILYDPRDPHGKDRLNMVKNREPFRPFGCTVLLQHAHNWFDMGGLIESPFMMYAMKGLPHTYDKIPAVLHVDNTCRVQTVCPKDNFNYYQLIDSFYQLTKIPLLLNTSFNLSGEPLVETPDDAIDTFECSAIDYLYFPEVQKLRGK